MALHNSPQEVSESSLETSRYSSIVDYHDCVITRKTHIRFRPSLRVRPTFRHGLGLNIDNNTVGDWPRVYQIPLIVNPRMQHKFKYICQTIRRLCWRGLPRDS